MATHEPVTVRPARPEDSEAVADIWRHGWRAGHLGHVPDALVAVRTEESFAARAAQRVGDTVVAVVDDAVAGFVMVVGRRPLREADRRPPARGARPGRGATRLRADRPALSCAQPGTAGPPLIPVEP